MKKNIHPEYRKVLFTDSATGSKFLIGSTLECDSTATYEGKEYPTVQISISSASHPFFTGDQKFVDTEGRVEKFMKRYAKKSPKKKDSGQEENKENKENQEEQPESKQ